MGGARSKELRIRTGPKIRNNSGRRQERPRIICFQEQQGTPAALWNGLRVACNQGMKVPRNGRGQGYFAAIKRRLGQALYGGDGLFRTRHNICEWFGGGFHGVAIGVQELGCILHDADMALPKY
jgi:hypothetical protein